MRGGGVMKISMHLRKRENGIYYVIFTDNNKQKWRSLKTKDKTTAQRLFNKFKQEYLRRNILPMEKKNYILLSEAVDEYLHYAETKSARTYETYKDSLKKFTAFSGNIHLSECTPKIIDQFIIYCQKTLRNKPVTINKELRQLKTFFNKCIEWEYLKNNPIKSFVKQDKLPPRVITFEDIKMLLDGVKNPNCKLFIEMALLTGMRRGELCKLEWQDIDFDNKTIIVRTSKSHRFRYIPMSDYLLGILQPHRKNIGKLFTFSPHTISDYFRKLTKRVGVNCRLHDLRHTFATYLLQSSGNIRVVQEILGHSSLNTTLIYAQALEDDKKQAINQLRIIK